MKRIGVDGRTRLAEQQTLKIVVRLESQRRRGAQAGIVEVHVVDAMGLQFETMVHTPMAHH